MGVSFQLHNKSAKRKTLRHTNARKGKLSRGKSFYKMYNNLVKINDDDIWKMMEKDEHVDEGTTGGN